MLFLMLLLTRLSANNLPTLKHIRNSQTVGSSFFIPPLSPIFPDRLFLRQIIQSHNSCPFIRKSKSSGTKNTQFVLRHKKNASSSTKSAQNVPVHTKKQVFEHKKHSIRAHTQEFCLALNVLYFCRPGYWKLQNSSRTSGRKRYTGL